MSWIELDDRILDHPKFIRAVKDGGGEAVFLWLGLRAYCSQHLTDGFIPEDMLDEVRGPRNTKARERAMRALLSAGLIHTSDAGYRMHDYLQWSSSRDQVLARREKASERKRKSRGDTHGSHGVTGSVTHSGTDGGKKQESQTPARAISSASAPSSASAAAEGAAASDKIPCPLDLDSKIPPGTYANLFMGKNVPEQEARNAVRDFARKYNATPGDRRFLDAWIRAGVTVANQDGPERAKKALAATELEQPKTYEDYQREKAERERAQKQGAA